MQLKRALANIFASSLTIAILVLIALPAYASAQQAADNNSDALAMPLSFILDNALDTQAQDIQENIFEYKFDAASNSPDAQSSLLQKRTDDLASDANDKKAFLKALIKKNATIPGYQISDMAGSVGASMDQLDKWSKKLENHAAGLVLLKGRNATSVQPLINNIQDTKGLSDSLRNYNGNNGYLGNIGNGPHGNGNPIKK